MCNNPCQSGGRSSDEGPLTKLVQLVVGCFLVVLLVGGILLSAGNSSEDECLGVSQSSPMETPLRLT